MDMDGLTYAENTQVNVININDFYGSMKEDKKKNNASQAKDALNLLHKNSKTKLGEKKTPQATTRTSGSLLGN